MKMIYKQQNNMILKKKDCDIIIRVRNEIKELTLLLNDLHNQKSVDFNVIILDTNSIDGTAEFLLNRKDVLLFSVDKADFHYGKSLDFLVSKCVSDYVFSFSSHIRIVDKEILYKTIQFLKTDQSSNVCAGYFRQVPNFSYGCSEYERVFLNHGFPKLKSPQKIDGDFKKIKFSNAASVFRRAEVAAFNFGKYNGSEDKIWAYNMIARGKEIVYFGNMSIQHSHNETLEQLKKRIFINYVAQMQFTHERIIPLAIFFKYLFGLIYLFPFAIKTHALMYARIAYKASREAVGFVFR